MNVAVRVFFVVIGMSAACVVAAEDPAAGQRESLPVSSATAQHDADAASDATTETRAGERATLTPDDDAAQAKRPEKTADRLSSAQSDSLLLLLLQLLRSPK